MALLVADCPRCDSKEITFDIRAAMYRGISYGWQRHFELACLCRRCLRPSLYAISDRETQTKSVIKSEKDFLDLEIAINKLCDIDSLVSFAEIEARKVPDHLPINVDAAFSEGAKCIAIGCYNAAATMFRLSLDLATRPLLPDPDNEAIPQPNIRQRRDLGLRLPWLFDNGHLPEALRDLASCIREDGNDGAHAGNLSKEDAEDILDFSFELLERLFTEPERLRLAAARREERRRS